MKHTAWLMILALLSVVLSSCSDNGGQPQSSSRPYEVTLVGKAQQGLTEALSQNVEGLPQPEPMFDVSRRKSLDEWSKLSRAVVICQRGRQFEVKQDVWARPQIVVYTDGSNPQKVVRMLNAFEMGQEVKTLRRSHNTKAGDAIRKMFGLEMLIPEGLSSSMVRPGFIWLSNNTPQGMKNIVVLRGNVNEALAKNIKGETDEMHMRLVAPGQKRGLWEMVGDAMGGPYVQRQVGDVTVIAFVYAPESKKRNLMRQLEAALYTIKQQHNGK